MNIFAIDDDPVVAAQGLCDQHVVKMVTETAQMLCSAYHVATQSPAPYKPTHVNHPCTKWAGRTRGNWDWLVDHGLALSAEYTYRYGKTHASQSAIQWCKDRTSDIEGSRAIIGWPREREDFEQCVLPQYKQSDSVEAYRLYYRGEKLSFARWKDTSRKPLWI